MRRNQIVRQWRLLERLEAARRGLTVAEMMAAGRVSQRTVYRDLVDLQRAGFPLHSKMEGEDLRWQFIDGYRFKTPRPMRPTELLALHLARDMLAAFRGTVFHRDLESLWQNVAAGLPAETRDFLDRLRGLYRIGAGPVRDYSARAEILARLNTALTGRRSVDIVYRSLKDAHSGLRRVDPYALYLRNATLYLAAFCRLRGEVRLFVVDRIAMLQPTEQRFSPPSGFDPDRYLADSFGVMRGPAETVRIRIRPDWARYVAERQWHPSQTVQQQIDGGIEIGFRVAGLDEIRQWVLSLGDAAQVLAPPELRQAVRESLARTLDQYPADEAVPVEAAPHRGDAAERTLSIWGG